MSSVPIDSGISGLGEDLDFAFPLETIWDLDEVERLPARTLAYIGDAVYELGVRLQHVKSSPNAAGKLHSSVVSVVCAAHQARLFADILPTLKGKEEILLKHWRNAKLPSRPHAGASKGEYARSTAFEAWVGYLFLTGQQSRLQSVFRLARTIAGSKPGAEPAPPDEE
ncbi:MAG: ribonuclease III [Candidatus Riflebacteria bacterium]|nr:ribonuclease III [Candidatus Riflebacteria bacterium]